MAIELKRVTQLAWRRFLQTDAGIEGMLFLRENSPAITPGEAHNIILQAGKAEQHRVTLDMIRDIIGTEAIKVEDLENR